MSSGSHQLRRHNVGNTLKSQDNREWIRMLPLKAMECGKNSEILALYQKPPDTVGELGRVENWASIMASATLGSSRWTERCGRQVHRV